MDVDEKKDEPVKEPGDSEKRTLKGGLNALLGDGKDDLEFDFETEKPERKKQKVEEKTTDKGDPKQGILKMTDGTGRGTPTTSERKTAEEDLLDFETPHPDIKESGTLAAQHGIDTSKAAVPDVMELETPIVAEADWTCALKIQNFVRPFTEKAAKEMLGTYGTVVDMWMPPIKTHCYVIYEKESEAHEAYLGTYNTVWPRSGKHLQSEFVAVDTAKKAIEDGRSRAAFARASGSASFHKTRPMAYAPTNRNQPDDLAPHGAPRQPPKPALSLEDLFFKTQAKPPIYYLPLTDEQVAERKRVIQEREAPAAKPSDGTRDA